MTAILDARSLTRTLAGPKPVHLVRDVSLTIERGSFTTIVGPSGCGKSSLLYLLGLIDRPDSGELLFEGREVSGLSGDARAAIRLARFGFVFQFHFLLPEFSALENVMLPMQRLGRLDHDGARQRALELLAAVGLDEKSANTPDRLSGGERQRVAIARALANDPVLILGDEPTGDLDSRNSARVVEDLRALAHEGGRAVACVTHDPGIAEISDVQIEMLDGRIENIVDRRA
ncbi:MULTISPECIES: ABC transporter ATP-binding protein [unclassified Novosphingobium]|uniref:ABC transporter ATP-binding protein n=1 Tax=unclassified Novosphingobium TaxID=2644732 RepID=UPI00020EF6DC|nr:MULTISPECIES: ABC transporter ATP-binding protein [unclassified Novosphingobium]BBA74128.1 ABC transporter-like protein [Novosphingobium sp. PY1]GFM31365.1 ABC transporter-like protein [Novosphingobium sp. PY1]CCA90494.1 ABC transporter related [Novosphingobium sp. PP1Y]